MGRESSTFADKSQQQALISKFQQVPLFNRCSSTHLQVMLKAARPVPFVEGHVLCEQGAPPSGVYVLMKGSLSIVQDGEEIDRLQPIATVGHISMLTSSPHGEEALALEAGLVLHMPFKLFEVLLSKDIDLYQRMSRFIIGELSAQLQRANEAQRGVAGRRADVVRRLEEARHELNDARMLRSMRGDEDD